jgi:hypothetical protein
MKTNKPKKKKKKKKKKRYIKFVSPSFHASSRERTVPARRGVAELDPGEAADAPSAARGAGVSR